MQEKDYSGVIAKLLDYITEIKQRQAENDQFIYQISQLFLNDKIDHKYQDIKTSL